MNTVKLRLLIILSVLFSQNLMGWTQEVKIHGRIFAFDTYGVNQAVVSAKRAGTTAVSDSTGYYILLCGENDKLTFEANGFNTKKVNLKRMDVSDSINVNLELGDSENSRELATGYGHIDKDNLSHAIERAETTNDFSEYASVIDIIKGRVSGVQIAGNSMTIRGPDTYNDSEPLIVVDGTVMDFTALNTIPTSQVKSVDVLKGASASARYGSRGMQGVIVIQTKMKK